MSFSSFMSSFKKHAADVFHIILRTGDVLQKFEPMIESAEAIVFPPAVAVTHAAAGALAAITNGLREAQNLPAAIKDNNVQLVVSLTAEEAAYYRQFVDFIHGHAASNGIPLIPAGVKAVAQQGSADPTANAVG